MPKCSQCDSLTINGVYCHETGCSVDAANRRHKVKCRECGYEYDDRQEICNCLVDDSGFELDEVNANE